MSNISAIFVDLALEKDHMVKIIPLESLTYQ